MAEFRFDGGVIAPANCADASPTGQLSYVYDYVVKKIQNSGFHDQTCTPWLHGNVKFENMQINQDITAVVNITATGNISAVSGTFGTLNVTGSLDGTPTGTLLARIAVADGLPVKPFDIPHPSKGDGHRLRYVCLEGPEVGVYFRGRLTNKTEIELPLYWKDLIHINSISVQLQPIGFHQDIIVKRVDEKKIYLQPNGGISIDCYYHVYAERKDVERLIVEYEGQSKNDYPSKNWRETYPKEFGEI